MEQKENKLILYKDDEGRVSVNVRFADEDVWLTQAQLVEIYQSSKSNVSEHIKHIFEDGELNREAVVRKFRTTASDGKNYNVDYYNLYQITIPRDAARDIYSFIEKMGYNASTLFPGYDGVTRYMHEHSMILRNNGKEV